MLTHGAVHAVLILLGTDYGNCMLSYSRPVMQLSIQSVFSAAEGAVGGGTIIPFVITTALDSIRAANDKYVRWTRGT